MMKYLFCSLALLLFVVFPRAAAAQACCSGDGTEARPFIISSAAELADLAAKINNQTTTGTYSNKHYKLNNDIDLSSYANWEPIAKELSTGGFYPFSGFFDGNNKKITGLKISGTSRYSGLFGAVYDGSVKDLSLEDVNVSGGDFTGGLAGVVNNAKISNCSVTGSVAGISGVGGIAGSISKNASITDCYAVGAVKGSYYAGGIAGYLDSSSAIANCYATGTVTGSNSGSGSNLAVVAIGGIAGFVENSSISQSAALNCAIQHSGSLGTGFGRVYGWNVNGIFSGNVAFDDMHVAVNLGDPEEAKDATTSLKTAAELQAADGFPPSLTNHFPCETTPIRLPQIAASSIHIKSIGKTIVLENVPRNAKIDIYNMQGRHIYSGNSENAQILRVPVQAKGIYAVRVAFGSEREMRRVVVNF